MEEATRPTARLIALVNQKGGCGKTTTAVNLAACLAVGKRRVLLVDLDPQANATVSLGVDPGRLTRTIYQVLIDDPLDGAVASDLQSVIMPSNVPNLEIGIRLVRQTQPLVIEVVLAPQLIMDRHVSRLRRQIHAQMTDFRIRAGHVFSHDCEAGRR